MAGTYTSRATAKVLDHAENRHGPCASRFSRRPASRPRRALISYSISSAGCQNLEDQIGGAMVGTSGQARAEYVATAVRDLQSFDVELRDNRAPHASSPARVGAGTVFSRSIIEARPDNAAPWRVRD